MSIETGIEDEGGSAPGEEPAPPNERLRSRVFTPAGITAVYVAFGLVLLVVSDVLLPQLIAEAGTVIRLQLLKGLAEVFLTGGLILLLVGRMRRSRERSEERYRNLVETSPAPINLFDAEGTTVWGNDAVLDLLGLDESDELVGRSIFEFIHPDDAPVAEEEIEAVIEEDADVGPTDFRLVRPDGGIRHVRVNTTGGWFEGRPVGQAVVVDLTDLLQTESALRAERNFIRSALDELRDVFFVTDREGRIERWNRRLVEVTGFEGSELESMSSTDLIAPEDESRARSAIESTLEEGEAHIEVDLLTGGGERREYEVKSARIDLEGAVEPMIAGIGRDVTERNRMARELEENERRYRTLVEMSPDPILVHVDGEIRYANGATADLLEVDGSGDLIGRDITRYVAPDEHDELTEAARLTQRGEATPTRSEWTVMTSGGSTRFVESTSRPIGYEGEAAVLTQISDVTDRHRYEGMLTTLHERTREMARAPGRETIAGIAVSAADELLETTGTVVYGLDGDELVPIAWSDDLETPPPSVDEGEAWRAFVDRGGGVFEGGAGGSIPIEEGVILSLGNHGVLVIGSPHDGPGPPARRNIAELIAEDLEAALDRERREQRLTERDRELERHNEALRQLNRLNELIREINRTLVRSTSRREVLEGVCEHFGSTDPYSFAWISSAGVGEAAFPPETYHGIDPEVADLLGPSTAPDPLVQLVETSMREGSIEVADELLDDPAWGPHREDLLRHGYRAVAVVPILRGDRIDSVLVVHAEEAGVFDEEERAVLEELGVTIGAALGDVERIDEAWSDERTEIELSIGDGRLFTNRLTDGSGLSLELLGLVPTEADRIRCFFRIESGGGTELASVAEGLESVSEVRALAVEDGAGVIQVTLSTPSVVETLRRHGARLRSLRAAQGTSNLTVGLTGDSGVRRIVEDVNADYPGTELVARRVESDPIDTRETFRAGLLEELTEKQREAIQTALYAGFYEWPRACTNEDLASAQGIAASTFQYHRRAAERKVIGSVLS